MKAVNCVASIMFSLSEASAKGSGPFQLKVTGVSAFALLASLGQVQSLSDTAELRKEIVVHDKLATVKEVLDEISAKTGTTLSVSNSLAAIQICVFTPKMKAYRILGAIATLEGAQWTSTASGYSLDITLETRGALHKMEVAEDAALTKIRVARLDALVKLELSGEPGGSDGPDIDSALETPTDWAKRVIGKPGYRTLALAARNVSANTLGSFSNFRSPLRLRAVAPPNPEAAAYDCFLKRPLSENEADLDHEQICARCIEGLGAIQCAVVASGKSSMESHPRVDLAASPFADDKLGETPIGPMIAGWTDPFKVKDDSIFNTETTVPDPKESDYIGGTFTQSEQLEAFADATRIPVVAETSRMKGVNLGFDASTTGFKWFAKFRSKTQGFARIADDIALFRERRFWRMRGFVIPEQKLRWLESRYLAGVATFDDYAAFADRIDPTLGVFNPRPLDRALLMSDQYLLRFPRSIFRESLPVLICFNRSTPRERTDLVVRHGIVSALNDLRHDTITIRFAAPYFRSETRGINLDLLLLGHPLDLPVFRHAEASEIAFLVSLGYERDDIYRIEHMERLRPPGALDNCFGCDAADLAGYTRDGLQPILGNSMTLWTGFDLTNRTVFHLTLPPPPQKN